MNCLKIESKYLALEVLPDQGGRIWSITQKWNSKQWLWHNPDKDRCAVKPGAGYDENWIGGWDDLFPNDALGTWQDMQLPDHGEIWSNSWTVNNHDQSSITMQCQGKVFPYQLTKKITLNSSETPKKASFRVEYRLENQTDRNFNLLFKLHPAFAVEEGYKLNLPDGLVEPVDLKFSSIIGKAEARRWPYVSDKNQKEYNLSLVPSKNPPHQEFVYVRELQDGFFTLKDTGGNEFKLQYPRDVFPSLWIFMDFGKWRGYRVMVVEPCTNYPKDLGLAVKQGCYLNLSPYQKLEFSVDVECKT